MTSINVPGVGVVEFPDDMSQEQIDQAISRQPPPPDQEAGQEGPGLAAGTARAAGQGLSLGFGDEIEAGVRSLVPESLGGRTYDELLEEVRGEIAKFKEDNPGLAIGSEVAGGIASAFIPGGAALRAASLGARAAKGAGIGAAFGGAQGFGSGEGGLENRLQSAAEGAVAGGALGAAGPAVAQGARKTIGAFKKATKDLRSVESIRDASNEAFEAARAAGINIKPGPFKTMVDKARETLRQEGFDPRTEPKIAVALSRLDDTVATGAPVDIPELHILRRLIGKVGKSNEAAERDLSLKLKGELDDFIDNLSDTQLTKGIGADRAKGTAAFKAGVSLWHRFRKSETIEDVVNSARLDAGQVTGAGMENALRKNFRRLAKDKKRRRVFSKAELAAIERVGAGGSIDNFFRGLSALAPSGIVSAVGSGGAGAAIGSVLGAPVVGAGAALGIGAGARAISKRLTKGNVEDVRSLTRTGRPAPRREINPRVEQILGASPLGSVGGIRGLLDEPLGS